MQWGSKYHTKSQRQDFHPSEKKLDRKSQGLCFIAGPQEEESRYKPWAIGRRTISRARLSVAVGLKSGSDLRVANKVNN